MFTTVQAGDSIIPAYMYYYTILVSAPEHKCMCVFISVWKLSENKHLVARAAQWFKWP